MFCQIIKFFWKNNSFSSPQSLSEFRPLWWQKRRCLRLLMSGSHWGPPGGTVNRNLPTDAGDTGSISLEDPTHRGAIKPVCHSYWAHSLEPESHTTEPVHQQPMLHKRSHRNEKPAHHKRVAPFTTTRESPRKATKTQESQKKKKKKPHGNLSKNMDSEGPQAFKDQALGAGILGRNLPHSEWADFHRQWRELNF